MAEEEKIERRYYNSAIGSWAGFIYQGWCAVYVVLHEIHKMLSEDKDIESVMNHRVYLDSFEDFSIHDGDNKAVSLHQCKLYKAKVSFDDAFSQMKENKQRLVDAGLALPEAGMFFHSNKKHVIDPAYEVSLYEDHEEETTRDSKDVIKRIGDLIDKIAVKAELNTFPYSARMAILQKIDEKVTEIQRKYHGSKKQLRELAREEDAAIRFNEIWEILTTDLLKDCPKNHLDRLIVYHFIENLAMKVEEYESYNHWDELLPEMVHAMCGNLSSMQREKIAEVLCRIYPDTNIHTGINRVGEMINNSRIENLIDLIGQTQMQTLEGIDWTVNGKFISPAVFDSPKLKRRMFALRNNCANLDVLREYNWLLATDVEMSIPNIGEHKHYISDISEISMEKSIFSEKQIGLLSIEDFNEGKV